MSTNKLDSFKNLKKNKYDWKVPARVLNIWKGYTRTGEPFKGFNLLLLDHKRCRIHAWVPSNVEEALHGGLDVGKTYLIENFTVKDYKPDEKFRCIRKDIQIVFGIDTKIDPLKEEDVSIEDCWFDFFEIADLGVLAKQNQYLTDVIGVMEMHDPIGKLRNKNGKIQSQIKFRITDGCKSVQVTLWDEFAESFAEELRGDHEYPMILIIGSGRIIKWGEEIVVTNVGSTTFYINSNHHSAVKMRKMISHKDFDRSKLALGKRNATTLYKITDVLRMEEKHIESNALCEVKFTMVHETTTWYQSICTSCYQKAEFVSNVPSCAACNRKLPHPDKRFILDIIAADETGELKIRLEDREVRTIIGKSVYQLLDEGNKEEIFPIVLKNIENKHYTVKIHISEENVKKISDVYIANDIMEGNFSNQVQQQQQSYPQPLSELEPQASTSTYNIASN